MSVIREIAHAVARMLTRGVVGSTDDSSGFQTVRPQAYGEDLPEVEHPHEYGFTSHAPDGAEVFVGTVDGEAGSEVSLIVGDRRYRLTGLEKGEVAIHDDQGQKIHLKRDGIEAQPKAGGYVKILGGDVRIGDGASDALTLWPGQKAILLDLLEAITGGLVAGPNPVTVSPAAVDDWLQLTIDINTDKPASTTSTSK